MPQSGDHDWVTQRQGGNPANIESYEWVTYCSLCGMEYPGDDADIPACEDAPDAE